MSRKLSAMGSSRYEFNPEQFDMDVQRNIERRNKRKDEIKNLILSELKKDPVRQDETYQMFIDALREYKSTK